jgi:hypothetical protein
MVEISITKQCHGKHIPPGTNMLEAECCGTKKRIDKSDYRAVANDKDAR